MDDTCGRLFLMALWHLEMIFNWSKRIWGMFDPLFDRILLVGKNMSSIGLYGVV